jgi:hypothetical protein
MRNVVEVETYLEAAGLRPAITLRIRFRRSQYRGRSMTMRPDMGMTTHPVIGIEVIGATTGTAGAKKVPRR